MIVLHSVTKSVGRAKRRELVLDDVTWTIAPNSRIVILGQAGAGKTTLLELIRGTKLPTSGWVERRAVVSPAPGLSRFAKGFTTPRQLIRRLSSLFDADPNDLHTFVQGFAAPHEIMDVPVQDLARHDRQALNLALFYGMPCDFYLFDGRVTAARGHLGNLCRAAFLRRRNAAGMILATDNPELAQDFGGSGALLHRGRLSLFASVQEAIAEFEDVRARDPLPRARPHHPHQRPEFEDDLDL